MTDSYEIHAVNWRDALAATIEAAEDGEHPEQAVKLLEHTEQCVNENIPMPRILARYLETCSENMRSGQVYKKAFNLDRPNHRPNSTGETNFNIAGDVLAKIKKGKSVPDAIEDVSKKYKKGYDTVQSIYWKWSWLHDADAIHKLISKSLI